MKIINGKKIADKILADLKKEIEEKKLQPCLAVILVGDDAASRLYVQKKEQAAQKIGIEIKKYNLSEQTSEKEILDLIGSLNQDKQINGILVQLPLPKGLSADRIIHAIALQKDVDGFLPKSKFDSPFILSIWQALQATKENLKNKKIVALVNSDVFGLALSRFLRKKGLKDVKYIKVRPFDSTTLPQDKVVVKRSDLKLKVDILISVCGQANFIKGDMIKKGVILIDGGISKQNGKVVGDIDQESVKDKAKWLSPVPGGLGPMTVAFLLKNVVLAAKNFEEEF